MTNEKPLATNGSGFGVKPRTVSGKWCVDFTHID